MRRREGQQAEEAHTAPVCQQSSYFITYLRAEIGGRVGEMERQRVCVVGEGEKEGFWVGERRRKMMSCCFLCP